MMSAEAAGNEKLGMFPSLPGAAFAELGGVPEEILLDRIKTVWQEADDRGEIVWNPVFLDFVRHWGFKPRLCQARRAQTKGKV